MTPWKFTGYLCDCLGRVSLLNFYRSGSNISFSGSMKTKRRKDVICEKKIPASYDFIVQMPYKECGIDKSVSD